jgi:RecB family exonuclease
LATRVPYRDPKVGHDWSMHVDWVATRLRMVPADFAVRTDGVEPADAATAVIETWSFLIETRVSDTAAPATITFSQLSTWQVCGREYAYRHMVRPSGAAALPPIVDVGFAAHEALAWLFAPGTPHRTQQELLQFYDARLSALSNQSMTAQGAWGRQVLGYFYAAHYLADRAGTVAVEAPVTLALSSDASFVGRLDRLAVNPAGEIEVTEFKLHETRHGSRPRLPELMQPAAYAAAVMRIRQVPRAFARLHFLEEDRSERVLLTEKGGRNVQMALLRWLNALRLRGFAARPGYHCRHCAYRRICPASQCKGDALPAEAANSRRKALPR